MTIILPVVCQNGHEALSIYRFDRQRMEFIWEGVPRDQSCNCPKFGLGEGWRANGEPYLVEFR